MRILFASTRGTGHFTPLVPLIEACLRGGHEVLVAGPPPLAETVARRGYPFREGASPSEEELGPVWGRVPTVSREEANAIVVGEIFGDLNVRAMLPALEAACADWRPDRLVREQAEFASAIAAVRHGVPQARVGVSLAGLEQRGIELVGPRLDAQEPGASETIWTSPYLTYVPAGLEDPATARPPDTRRLRDPAGAAAAGAREAPPLVFVSFGTEVGAMPVAQGLYRAVFEAADTLGAQVVLTLGQRDADVTALGRAPDNVRVEPWVDPAEVLGRASVAVSHGGFGTTMGAIAAGLPLVVVPLFGDQPDNAARIEGAGAGVVVWPDGPPEAIRSAIDPAALRAAIEAALNEPALAEVAARLAAEMAAHPTADEVVAELTDARR